MWENNDYRLHFAADAFYRHEQIILTEGSCEGFLPMTFLREGNALIAAYEPAGARPLSRFRIERTADALYLMEQVLTILHAAPAYLLAPERVTLRLDTLFYSKMRDRLRIAFVPAGDEHVGPEEKEPRQLGRLPLSPLARQLLQLLAQLKEELRDDHAGLILRLAKTLYEEQQDTGRMLRCVGLLRRELETAEAASGSR